MVRWHRYKILNRRTKFAEYRGGSFLKVADLEDREHIVIIEDISPERVGEDQKIKLCVSFEGWSKKLVLNDTTSEALEQLFGRDTDAAVGGKIAISPDHTVKYGGKRVGGIRLKPAKKTATPAKSMAEELDDDIPDFA